METVNSRIDFLGQLLEYLPRKTTVVEIGVLNGDLSYMLLDQLMPEKLFLIDSWEEGEEKYEGALSFLSTAYSTEQHYKNILDRFDKEIFDNQVIVDKNFSYDAVKNYPDNYFDLIYIDADHRYEAVKRDLNDWLSKLKKEGIISGHDYIKFPGFGVIEAVDDFTKEQNFEMIVFNENGGDFALKRIS